MCRVQDTRTEQQIFDDLMERSSLGGPAAARRSERYEQEKKSRMTGMSAEQADWDDEG